MFTNLFLKWFFCFLIFGMLRIDKQKMGVFMCEWRQRWSSLVAFLSNFGPKFAQIWLKILQIYNDDWLEIVVYTETNRHHWDRICFFVYIFCYFFLKLARKIFWQKSKIWNFFFWGGKFDEKKVLIFCFNNIQIWLLF